MQVLIVVALVVAACYGNYLRINKRRVGINDPGPLGYGSGNLRKAP